MPPAQEVLKISSTATSSMATTVTDVTVDRETTTGAGSQEAEWVNPDWDKFLGYYKNIPECKAATDTLVRWVVGEGYVADPETTVILDHVTGWGVETFDEILENMFKTCLINGDSFAEVIKTKDGVLANLKILDPSTIKIRVTKAGIIKEYVQTSKIDKSEKVFKKEDIFHLSYNRVADEIHGLSQYECISDIISALNESFKDFKTVVHRNVVPLRVLEIDTDDTTAIAALSTKYENMIKNKEIIFIPKGTINFADAGLPSNQMNPLPWRDHLRSYFWQTCGIPQILMGSAQDFTESSAKVAFTAFSQTCKQLQRYITTQIWNQLYLRVDLELPTTLMSEMISMRSDKKQDGAAQGMNFTQADVNPEAAA